MKKLLFILLSLFIVMSCDLMKEEKSTPKYVGKWRSESSSIMQGLESTLLLTIEKDNYELIVNHISGSFIGAEKGSLSNQDSDTIKIVSTHDKPSINSVYIKLTESEQKEGIFNWVIKNDKLILDEVKTDGSIKSWGAWNSID